jgi:Domain of unknown function (DUF5122) beta-propeller
MALALSLMILTAFTGKVCGAPGGIDNTFIQQGPIDAPICAVVVDSQTNIWIGGRFFNVYGHASPYLAVLNPDGTLNTNLPDNGLHASIGVIHSLDVDDVGNIYVAGAQGMARLNHIFGNNSWQNDAAFQATARNVVRRGESVAVSRGFGTSADTIYVAGSVDYTNGNNVEVFNVVALDVFGNVISGYNIPANHASDQISQVRYIRPCSCGINTIGIPFVLLSGGFGVMLTDYTGTIYSSYSDGNLRSCAAMRNIGTAYFCPSPYGEIVSGGFFQASYFANGDTYSGFTLDRFGGTVPNWFHDIKSSHFPQDNGGGIAAIETFEGGDIVIAGLFTTIHGVNKPNFAHLWADGTVDTSFTDASDIPTFAMALQPDGKFILVGETTSSPFGGRIGRRMGMNPYRAVAFTEPASSQTLFLGENNCYQPAMAGSPAPFSFAWFKDNSALPTQTNNSICINNATTNDTGDYRLRAETFCGSPSHVESATIHLTVLAPPPPPGNDMFSNAYPLAGSSSTGTSYIRSATTETGEPNHAGQSLGHSVWWNWTAPFNGRVRLSASSSEFTAALGVYKGNSVSSLTLVTNGFNTNLTFTVVSNTTYRIAVAGIPLTGSMGNVVLQLNPIALFPLPFIAGNPFSFQATGPDTGKAFVETTTSLNPPNWQPFSTNTLVNGSFNFVDPRPLTNAALFYRVRLQ